MIQPSTVQKAVVFIGLLVTLCMCADAIAKGQSPKLVRGAERPGPIASARELPARVDAGQPLRPHAAAQAPAGLPTTVAGVTTGGPAGDTLALARAGYLESGFSVADCRAELGVLRVRARRAGVSLAGMAYSYTALGRGWGLARNDFARALPDGDEPTWNTATNQRWLALRKTAAGFVAGRVGTPCRGASHFGSRVLRPDKRRAERAIKAGRWQPVKCRVPTLQAYFREV